MNFMSCEDAYPYCRKIFVHDFLKIEYGITQEKYCTPVRKKAQSSPKNSTGMHFYAATRKKLSTVRYHFGQIPLPSPPFFYAEILAALFAFLCATQKPKHRFLRAEDGQKVEGGGDSRIFESCSPIAILMRFRDSMSRIRKYKLVKCNETRKHFHTSAVI